MNIKVHIERLVLYGVPVTQNGRPVLQAAVQAELARLLSEGGVSAALEAGGAIGEVRTAGMQAAKDATPAELGAGIAGAVYGGIGK